MIRRRGVGRRPVRVEVGDQEYEVLLGRVGAPRVFRLSGERGTFERNPVGPEDPVLSEIVRALPHPVPVVAGGRVTKVGWVRRLWRLLIRFTVRAWRWLW